MGVVRPPTLAELVVMIGRLPDGPERAFLERCYWGKAVERYGIGPSGRSRAEAYRWEYDQLREQRRRRLAEFGRRPTLGAYRDERSVA